MSTKSRIYLPTIDIICEFRDNVPTWGSGEVMAQNNKQVSIISLIVITLEGCVQSHQIIRIDVRRGVLN